MVVDLWGGWADEARTVPWGENTITNVFSTTKCMTSLAALVLVDRGELDLDTTAATYWPEFAANGKAGIKVRRLLSHTSGVSGWDQPITLDDLYDWDKSTAPFGGAGALVGTRHGLGLPHADLWPPDRRSDPARHRRAPGRVFCRAHCGAVGRRLSHRSAALGVPSRRQRGAATFPVRRAAARPQQRGIQNLDQPGHERGNDLDRRLAARQIGAGNGHRNARSLARIQSAVACGGEVAGVRLLSPKTIDRIFEVQFDGIDLVIGIPIRWGVDWGLATEGRVCSWGGAGGSSVIIDADRRITFAYVMNKMAPGGGTIAAALAERVKDIVNR